MSKADAKRTACRIAATILQSTADGWETLDPWPKADQDRIAAAWDDLITEMAVRGQNAPPIPKEGR